MKFQALILNSYSLTVQKIWMASQNLFREEGKVRQDKIV